jgi:protein required for attachment to host cells
MREPKRLDPIGLLRRCGHDYHHLQNEHIQQPPGGSVRRHLAHEMDDLRERFEGLLDHWVRDPELQRAWRRFFYHGAAPPEDRRVIEPPLFKGATASGSLVEIRPGRRGFDLMVDGQVIEHQSVPWYLEQDFRGRVRVAGFMCEEVFGAPNEAVAELGRFLGTSEAPPPWRWARALVEDGLIDADFSLTERGERRLRRPPRPAEVRPAEAIGGVTVVLVASAARARILVLPSDARRRRPTSERLTEVAEIVDPERRARDSEMLSDTRPGLRREGRSEQHGQGHAVSDHREGHRRNAMRLFARGIADELARVCGELPRATLIVAATPHLLGQLRPELRGLVRNGYYDVVEIARDWTRLAPAALHDALAEAGYVPTRARLTRNSLPEASP